MKILRSIILSKSSNFLPSPGPLKAYTSEVELGLAGHRALWWMQASPGNRAPATIESTIVNAPLPKGRGFYRFCEEIASPISGC
jgi:hypothetical protein